MVSNVEQNGKLKTGGAIGIRMCECHFKNPIWGHFLKKKGKNKKNQSLYWKMLQWIWVWRLGAYFFQIF